MLKFHKKLETEIVYYPLTVKSRLYNTLYYTDCFKAALH